MHIAETRSREASAPRANLESLNGQNRFASCAADQDWVQSEKSIFSKIGLEEHAQIQRYGLTIWHVSELWPAGLPRLIPLLLLLLLLIYDPSESSSECYHERKLPRSCRVSSRTEPGRERSRCLYLIGRLPAPFFPFFLSLFFLRILWDVSNVFSLRTRRSD